MTHISCRLTAKNRDQLRNPTLGNREGPWATFTFTSAFSGFHWWGMTLKCRTDGLWCTQERRIMGFAITRCAGMQLMRRPDCIVGDGLPSGVPPAFVIVASRFVWPCPPRMTGYSRRTCGHSQQAPSSVCRLSLRQTKHWRYTAAKRRDHDGLFSQRANCRSLKLHTSMTSVDRPRDTALAFQLALRSSDVTEETFRRHLKTFLYNCLDN